MARSRAAKDRNLGQFKVHYDRVLPSMFDGVAVDGLKQIDGDFIERAKNWLKSDESSIIDKHANDRLSHVLEKCSIFARSYAELWWMTVESFCKVPRGKDGSKKNYRKRYDHMKNMPDLPAFGGGEVAHEEIDLLSMDENEEESSEDSLLSDEKSVQSFSASLCGVDVSFYDFSSEAGPSTNLTYLHPQFHPSEDLMLEADEQKKRKRKKSSSIRQMEKFKDCFRPMLPKVAESPRASDTMDQDDLEQFKKFSINMLENCKESKIELHKKERLRYVLGLPGITSALSIWCLSVKAFHLEFPRGEDGKKMRYKSSKVAD